MKKTVLLATVLFGLSLATPAFAEVDIDNPWVRSTVPQQQSTGAFMTITSDVDARLLEVRSPAAETVELHTMEMEDDVMRMRSVDTIELTAGEPVELRPGSFHVMLIGLVEQAKEGDTIPLTLVFESAEGEQTLDIEAEVRALTQRHDHSGH
ncbi:MAG TPA: copper chaperone PCu(A)C [Azoarcus sp.]|nr:copper chaperone PCu(A)C [Azoarcus sp.]